MKFLIILDKTADASYVLTSQIEYSLGNQSTVSNEIESPQRTVNEHKLFIDGTCKSEMSYINTEVIITYYNAENKVVRITTKELRLKLTEGKFEKTTVSVGPFDLTEGYVEVTAVIKNKSSKRTSVSNTLTYK